MNAPFERNKRRWQNIFKTRVEEEDVSFNEPELPAGPIAARTVQQCDLTDTDCPCNVTMKTLLQCFIKNCILNTVTKSWVMARGLEHVNLRTATLDMLKFNRQLSAFAL